MQFEDIYDIFEDVLSKKQYQQTFSFTCFFGSMNLKTDLDFFVIPGKDVRKGRFLKELVLFLKEIKAQVRKKNHDLLVIMHSTFEEEVHYIASKATAMPVIKLHVSSFPDIHPVPIKDLLPVLNKTKFVLKGRYSDINQMKSTKLDYYYNYLFITNCLLSNYPKSLEKEKISNKANYIYRHLAGKKKNLQKNTEKIFFDCCDFLDKQA